MSGNHAHRRHCETSQKREKQYGKCHTPVTDSSKNRRGNDDATDNDRFAVSSEACDKMTDLNWVIFVWVLRNGESRLRNCAGKCVLRLGY